ncbi:uncharacterized protein [Eurosta solidaginis]|uniref:uncharacterized protein n=1 Tax=Eurosta solidaginis TaxID=178769 RepID=UPI0035314BCE
MRMSAFNALLLTFLVGNICHGIAVLVRKDLWLGCSCMYARERNAANWGNISINSSMLRNAKNDCYLIFIAGGSDELVAFRFHTLQLSAGCLDYIEIFPFLRDPVIDDSSIPDYVICNRTAITSTNVSAFASTSAATMLANNGTMIMNQTQSIWSSSTTTISAAKQYRKPIVNAHTTTMAALAANNKKAKQATMNSVAIYEHLSAIDANNSLVSDGRDLRANEFIYSAGKIFGIRVRLRKRQQQVEQNSLQIDGDYTLKTGILNITGEYRFFKKEYFKNDGRLIPGTYCDYYFFADANAKPESFEIWKYFHSPRFPAKYPAHIQCAYKFIGRPETRVEVVFEELQLPKTGESCSIDKLTIFDSESANMNAVIDVICDAPPTRRIFSSGPDLLIEFNASSNITSKGFRGKFKFTHNEVVNEFVPAVSFEVTTDKVIALERIGFRKETQYSVLTVDGWNNFFKNNAS